MSAVRSLFSRAERIKENNRDLTADSDTIETAAPVTAGHSLFDKAEKIRETLQDSSGETALPVEVQAAPDAYTTISLHPPVEEMSVKRSLFDRAEKVRQEQPEFPGEIIDEPEDLSQPAEYSEPADQSDSAIDLNEYPDNADLPAQYDNRPVSNIEVMEPQTGLAAILDTVTGGTAVPEVQENFEMHTLSVSNLHKKFGRKEVVRGISFSMHNGEVAGLLGPNGAGKTTTFYMIVGFYHPTQGIVTLDDVNITEKPMFRRARLGIAYLPQEASIFRKLTVEQNIWAVLESRRDINKAERKEKLEYLLDEFGIGRIRSQYGFTLSGGERRRTVIARALATEPKFLLLDEPFAGIDPIAVFEIKQIIRSLAQKGIGVLITDHNVRDTLEITNEAFIIADGNIVAHGDRYVILADEMVREVYLGSEFRM